jgi:hypothetical protein
MRPIDFAWGSLRTITQKQPNDIKLLIDDTEYPRLETDSVGFVLHLSSPHKHRDNLYRLHGMYFDNDMKGRASLWRMFRASVYHMCLHSVTTDYSIYHPITDTASSVSNLLFAISLVEDYALMGHMKARWKGLLLDTAYANYLSAKRFRKLDSTSDASTRVAANLLSLSMTGRPLVSFDNEIDKGLRSLHRALMDVESISRDIYSQSNKQTRQPGQADRFSLAKIGTVQRISDFLDSQSCDVVEIPSPPFADNHGPNNLFESAPEIEPGDVGDVDVILRNASAELLPEFSKQEIIDSERHTEGEAQGVLGDWEYSLSAMKKLVEIHKSVDPRSHFEGFLFPNEDYCEFVRTRTKLIGPIRLVLDRLRSIKFTSDESQGKESGYVDIPTAIQVVASKSERNDVFVQEENELRSEAWTILIDSSKSLETFQSEVRDVAVCLAEVAKDLIPNPHSWSCYSFNENLYIIKDFTEIYGNISKSRIGGLSSGLKTYLPDAMRIAAGRLKSSTEDVKVMLVVSDGFPLGYEGIDQELLDTIDKIKKANIQLVGMGIGSSSMKKYFRTNFAVNSPFELMKNFIRTYTEISSSF